MRRLEFPISQIELDISGRISLFMQGVLAPLLLSLRGEGGTRRSGHEDDLGREGALERTANKLEDLGSSEGGGDMTALLSAL
jgi:hypothetical protein